MMLYKSITRIFSTIFLLAALSLGCSTTWAKASELCQFQSDIARQGDELYQRQQYLLSANQYSLLFHSKCGDVGKKSRYNYALTMYQLGELKELVAQYRHFYQTGYKYKDDLKTLVDLASENEDNPRVAAWLNLNGEKSLENLKLSDLELKTLHEQYLQDYDYKSPYLAGVMSTLVPGAGQLYNGSYQSAAISCILNSIFLWSTLELIDRDLDGAAVASGMVFSVTYFGNILNAVRGANKLNDVKAQATKNKIKKKLLPELELR